MATEFFRVLDALSTFSLTCKSFFRSPRSHSRLPSAVGGLQVALVQDGGDVAGVIEAVLILGAQSGGAQSYAMRLLWLPPERKQNSRKSIKHWFNSSTFILCSTVNTGMCPASYYTLPPSVKRTHSTDTGYLTNLGFWDLKWSKLNKNSCGLDHNSLKFGLQGCHFGVQRLLELLLLLQVPENLPADSLQALHLPLALVHLSFQGLHAQGQLGMKTGRGRGLEGNRGGHRWRRRGEGVRRAEGFCRGAATYRKAKGAERW